jgi:hypothetical protein
MKPFKSLFYLLMPLFFMVGAVLMVSPLYAEKLDEETVQEKAVTAPVDPGPGGILVAKVVAVEPKALVVENTEGDISRVPMPGESGKTADDFSVGDKIEAVITPEGITTSVRPVPSPVDAS